MKMEAPNHKAEAARAIFWSNKKRLTRKAIPDT